MRPTRINPAPGQESVWDYPRPPRLERTPRRIRVVLGGETIVDTSRAYRVLETSHPPVYYVPPEDIRPGALAAATGGSFCEWKGPAVYFHVHGGGKVASRAGWSYPDPTEAFAPIAGYVAFYAGPMDGCFVDEKRVTPQPGGFYGGWITSDVVGPFKGEQGTGGW